MKGITLDKLKNAYVHHEDFTVILILNQINTHLENRLPHEITQSAAFLALTTFFREFVKNSIDANAENLDVIARVLENKHNSERSIMFKVVDNGNGLPPAQCGIVNSEVAIAQHSTKTGANFLGGAHLGLALIAKVLEIHGGQLICDNACEGYPEVKAAIILISPLCPADNFYDSLNQCTLWHRGRSSPSYYMPCSSSSDSEDSDIELRLPNTRNN